MSDINPHEPLVRKPNTGPTENRWPNGRPLTVNEDGTSIHETTEQAHDDEAIVGPDGDRG
jgi:hypothetical protein